MRIGTWWLMREGVSSYRNMASNTYNPNCIEYLVILDQWDENGVSAQQVDEVVVLVLHHL